MTRCGLPIGARPCVVLALLVCSLTALRSTPAHAQLQTGNLYGQVTDNQGEPLPGVTVTLYGQGASQVQVTNAEGGFRFLGLRPGKYSLTNELEGFSTVDYPNIAIRKGRNTTIEVGLSPAIEEVITVTSESPLLDERKIQTGTTVSQIELDKIPTARDPWVVLQSTPGIITDRINVGGNESGQQSTYIVPGGGDGSVQAVDGIVITDGAALGASPTDYDFDAFEEVQTSTGGTDAPLASGGLRLVMETRRGTNNPRFSGRYLMSEDDWGSVDGFAAGDGGAPDLEIDLRPGAEQGGYCADFRFAGLDPGSGYPPAGISPDPALVLPADLFDPPTMVDRDGDGVPDTAVRSVPGCTGGYGLDFYHFDPFKAGTGSSWGGFTFGSPDVVLSELSDPTSSKRDVLGASLVFDKGLSDRWLLRGHLAVKDWEWGTQEPLVVVRLLDDPEAGSCYRIEVVLPDGERVPSPGLGDAFRFDMPLPGGVVDPDQHRLQSCDPDMSDFHFVPEVHLSSHVVPGRFLNSVDLREIFPGDGIGSFYVNGSESPDERPTLPTVPGGDGNGFFILGVDTPGEREVGDQPALTNPFRLQVDLDGDGTRDVPFFDGGDFTTVSPGISYGAFTVEPGEGGGRLVTDPDAPHPYVGFLQDRIRVQEYFNLNFGVPADALETGDASQAEARDPSKLFEHDSGERFRLIETYRSGGFPSFAEASDFVDEFGASLGGPIETDRVWFLGTYGLQGRPEVEREFTYFTTRYFEYGLSPGAESFSGSDFTLPPIRSAPAGRGVQDVGIEISTPFDERYAPGGATESPRDQEPTGEPLLYVVARGGSSGEVYDVVIVHPPEGRVAIDGIVVVEPVATTAADRARFERELARAPGERETVTAAGYCLEMDRFVPPPGTVYRIAPAAKQARYEPMRRALEAASRLRDAGGLDPDSDPTEYYHAIRQWAVWSVEKGFDRAGFLDAFTERTRKNFREAGQPWSAQVADAVRAYGEGRWEDIREVLDAVGRNP